MNSKNNGSFWPSYVDVMTTLFAITLILFAVSFSRFKIKEKQLQGLVDEYENIITVYSTVGEIDSTKYFGYNEKYLKHLFSINVEYQTAEYHINKLKYDLVDISVADKTREDIVEAGRVIQRTIESIEHSNDKNNNIKFLVVIEGQSSKIEFKGDDWKNNYTLSYLRAQYLNKFWVENGIVLDSIPRCELIISGSGEGGVPRHEADIDMLKLLYKNNWVDEWKFEEAKNQRFLIHIVPVIGNIEVTKEKFDEIKGNK